MTGTGYLRMVRFGLAVLAAVGLTLVDPRPAMADFVKPVIHVTGSAACTTYDDSTRVGWKVTQDPQDGGALLGGPATFQATPDVPLFPNTNYLISAIQISQTIPHGSGAATASLTVSVAFESTPWTVTETGTVTLPFCPNHVLATVGFVMNCDRSVNVTITYPTTAEAATTAGIFGSSLSGAGWQSGGLSLKAGGEVRTVLVPSPYTTDIVVVQDGVLPSQGNGTIGRSGQLMQPTACPISPGGPPAANPPPANQGSGASGGGSSSDSDTQIPTSGGAAPEPSASGRSVNLAEGRAAAGHQPAAPVAAGPRSMHMPLAAVAVLGLLGGLGAVVVLAGCLAAVVAIRQRRRPAS